MFVMPPPLQASLTGAGIKLMFFTMSVRLSGTKVVNTIFWQKSSAIAETARVTIRSVTAIDQLTLYCSPECDLCEFYFIDPLESRGNYSAISNDRKLVHWPLAGGLLHLVERGGGTGRGPSPPRPLLSVPNVTAHPSTTSVPITVLLYNGPLLCGFNVGIKGLGLSIHGIYTQSYVCINWLAKLFQMHTW